MKKLVFKDIPSPVGLIRAIATNDGLAAIIWEGEDLKRVKLETPLPANDNAILLETEKQLAEYFGKKRTEFDVPLDLHGTGFQKRVWRALLTIPFGQTKTYGQLAALSGDVKAVRAVGDALNKNPVSIIVPCHRIIGSSGKLVGFAGGIKNKSILLELEQKNMGPDLFNQDAYFDYEK